MNGRVGEPSTMDPPAGDARLRDAAGVLGPHSLQTTSWCSVTSALNAPPRSGGSSVLLRFPKQSWTLHTPFAHWWSELLGPTASQAHRAAPVLAGAHTWCTALLQPWTSFKFQTRHPSFSFCNEPHKLCSWSYSSRSIRETILFLLLAQTIWWILKSMPICPVLSVHWTNIDLCFA